MKQEQTQIRIGDCGLVSSIDTGSRLYKRLTDIGLVKGTPVQFLSYNMGKSLVLLQFRDTLIALRLEDAAAIHITPSPIPDSIKSEVFLLGTD